MRTTTFHAAGHSYTVPDLWLVGRARIREHDEGLDPRQAYAQALRDWVEQVNLALEHTR